MKLAISKIIVGERFRKNYQDMDQLENSLSEHGLLQPIVVDDSNNLIAGGRRLQAALNLNWTEIPVSRLKDVDEHTRRVLELEENVQRSNLEWHEEVALKAEIHRLQLEKYGQSESGRASDESKWSIEKTAAMLGESKSNTHEDLQLAGAIESMPELKQAKNKTEAKKMVKKLLTKAIMSEQHRRKVLTEDQTDKVNYAEKIYIISDVLVGLRAFPDEQDTFMFAEVDPPYGVDLTKVKRHYEDDSKFDGYHEVSATDYPAWITEVAQEVYRVLAKDAWCVWWFGLDWYDFLYGMLDSVGFDVDRIPAIWAKPQGQTNNPELYLGRAYETFFILRKGSPVLPGQGRPNVFAYSTVPPQSKIHLTEKPLDLMIDILTTLAHPASDVLVPFAGSGVTLRAALLTGRDAVGFELTDEFKAAYLAKVAEDKA